MSCDTRRDTCDIDSTCQSPPDCSRFDVVDFCSFFASLLNFHYHFHHFPYHYFHHFHCHCHCHSLQFHYLHFESSHHSFSSFSNFLSKCLSQFLSLISFESSCANHCSCDKFRTAYNSRIPTAYGTLCSHLDCCT